MMAQPLDFIIGARYGVIQRDEFAAMSAMP